MKLRPAYSILGALMLIGVADSSVAQIPLTDEFQVNTFTTGDQFAYGAAMDRRGDFIVTWDSDGEDGNSFSAIARLFDQTQAPVTGDLQANTFTTGAQDYARVGMDGSGRFVVVWASENQDGSSYGIYARRYDEAGNPISAEIPVNNVTSGSQFGPFVGVHPSGSFVVAWSSANGDGSGVGTKARRFDAAGAPLGNEFVVNTFTPGSQYADGVAVTGTGNFMVTWTQIGGGASDNVYARMYDPSGNPYSDPIEVDFTPANSGYSSVAADGDRTFVVVWQREDASPSDIAVNEQRFDISGARIESGSRVNTAGASAFAHPAIAMDSFGNFIVGWQGPDASGTGLFTKFIDRLNGFYSNDIPVNASTAGEQHHIQLARNDAGDFVAAWHGAGQDGSGYGVVARRAGVTAYGGVQVDVHAPAAPATSNLNGILEPGETAAVETTWANRTLAEVDLPTGGTVIDFRGPVGADYTTDDFQAGFGTALPPETAVNCHDATGDCYVVTVSSPATRPVQHWDALMQEQLSFRASRTLPLHVGGSFPDVPQNVFYPFIENLFHNGITGGCAGGGYCPGSNVTRAQMAVFLLKSKYSAAYVPPPATGTVFADVPASNPFAPWIENLAALGITGGCGGGNYCPNASVTRAQMAVFLLKTKNGSSYAPPTGAGIFGDVTCPGTFCDFIEDLYNQQITGGCSTSPLEYCPNNPNLRQQMAVFLVKTFGLRLYGL